MLKQEKENASTPNQSIFQRAWARIKRAFTSLIDGIKKIFERSSNKSEHAYGDPNNPNRVIQTVHRQLPPMPGDSSTPTLPVGKQSAVKKKELIFAERTFRDDTEGPLFRDDSTVEPPQSAKQTPSKPAAVPLPPKTENPKPAMVSQATPEEVVAFKKQLEEFIHNDQVATMVDWAEGNKESICTGMGADDVKAFFKQLRDSIDNYYKTVHSIDEKQLSFILPPALRNYLAERSGYMSKEIEKLKGKENPALCHLHLFNFKNNLEQDVNVMRALAEAKQLMDEANGKSLSGVEVAVQAMFNEPDKEKIRGNLLDNLQAACARAKSVTKPKTAS